MIPTRTERLIAAAAAAAAVVTLMALAALHVLSPEFDPAWRMVSEYALGQYSSILSIMFGCWALSSWALTAAVWRRATGVIARTGALLLALAGMGEVMAAWFDVLHPLHGLAALLGVPSLPVAAAILTFSHSGRAALGGPNAALSISAHLTWVAFVTLAIAMFVLMTTFQEAGGDMSAVAACAPRRRDRLQWLGQSPSCLCLLLLDGDCSPAHCARPALIAGASQFSFSRGRRRAIKAVV